MRHAPNDRPIRVLPSSAAPAAEQLAGSIALLAGLEQTGVPAMRWYQFRPPALLLGSSQQPHEVDLAACAAAGVPVHRRRSGGGAVLSDSLLLLDLALPPEDPLYTGDVTESYRWLGAVWAAVLGALGMTTHVIDITTARSDAQILDPLLRRVCFGGLSPNEIEAQSHNHRRVYETNHRSCTARDSERGAGHACASGRSTANPLL